MHHPGGPWRASATASPSAVVRRLAFWLSSQSRQSRRLERRHKHSRAETGSGPAGNQRSRKSARRSRVGDCATAWVSSSASSARARVRAAERSSTSSLVLRDRGASRPDVRRSLRSSWFHTGTRRPHGGSHRGIRTRCSACAGHVRCAVSPWRDSLVDEGRRWCIGRLFAQPFGSAPITPKLTTTSASRSNKRVKP